MYESILPRNERQLRRDQTSKEYQKQTMDVPDDAY